MKKQLEKQDVVMAILEWPGKYEEEGNGRVFLGMPVSQVPSQLVQCGWRRVSHLDQYDFEKMGLTVVTARYVGGVHPKRFCRVIVAAEVKGA